MFNRFAKIVNRAFKRGWVDSPKTTFRLGPGFGSVTNNPENIFAGLNLIWYFKLILP
jgi:hypothetical protein